jgi:hypothetical protein
LIAGEEHVSFIRGAGCVQADAAPFQNTVQPIQPVVASLLIAAVGRQHDLGALFNACKR